MRQAGPHYFINKKEGYQTTSKSLFRQLKM